MCWRIIVLVFICLVFWFWVCCVECCLFYFVYEFGVFEADGGGFVAGDLYGVVLESDGV